MNKKIVVSISEEELANIKKEVREDLEHEFNSEKLMEYLKRSHDVSFQEYLWNFGLSHRIDELKDTKVKDLTDSQKLLLATYWFMIGIGSR